MEKLIELLNEYEKEVKKSEKVWSIDNDGDICRKTYEGVDYNEYTEYMNTNNLISKSFLFIKWLVDNNKIDTGGKITEDLTYEYFQIPRKYFRGGKYKRLSEEMNDIFYHRILACLSIQDNPIEFLVSILK